MYEHAGGAEPLGLFLKILCDLCAFCVERRVFSKESNRKLWIQSDFSRSSIGLRSDFSRTSIGLQSDFDRTSVGLLVTVQSDLSRSAIGLQSGSYCPKYALPPIAMVQNDPSG
jgi:hypothetical protein